MKGKKIILLVLSLVFIVGMLSTTSMAAGNRYNIIIDNPDEYTNIGDDDFDFEADRGIIYCVSRETAGEEVDVRAHSFRRTRVLKSLVITRMDTGEEIKYFQTNSEYVTFVMPESDVKISAEFVEADSPEAGSGTGGWKGTATAISGGQIVLIGGIGLLIGLLIGAGSMAAFHKKKSADN